MLIYLKLFLISLVTIFLTFLFWVLKKYTCFKKIPHKYQQIIIGVSFALIAMFNSTKLGSVPLYDNEEIVGFVNTRDAVPLIAGLVFGSPAGLISGFVGGFFRLCTPLWKFGLETHVACGLSTMAAGIYAALLRKFMFNDKRPSWGFALPIGIVVESFHMLMVYITHIYEQQKALEIIKYVAFPMIFGTCASLFIALFTLQLIDTKQNKNKTRLLSITSKFQLFLLFLIINGYLASSLTIYGVQTSSSFTRLTNELTVGMQDATHDVESSIKDGISSVLNDVLYYKNFIKENQESNVTLCEGAANYLRTKYQELDGINLYLIEINDENGEKNSKIIEQNDDCQSPQIDMRESAQVIEFDDNMRKIKDENSDDVYCQPLTMGSDNMGVRKFAARFLKDKNGQIDYNHYIQLEISEDSYIDYVENIVMDVTGYRHIGNHGNVIIINPNGTPIVHYSVLENIKESFENLPSELEFGLSKEEIDDATGKGRKEGKIYSIRSFYMVSEPHEGFKVITTLPYEEIMSDRDSIIYMASFAEIILFALLFVLLDILIKVLVVRKIETTNLMLEDVANGNLNAKLNIKSTKEFNALSNGINETVEKLNQYIKDAEMRIDAELAFAKTIQESSLPSVFPAYPEFLSQFDVYATMTTAKEVGGDFYDLFLVDRNHLVILIADVSGKGIPAAMFMMESKTMLKNLAKNNLPVEEILTKANQNLCQGNNANMFVTCWMGILELSTGILSFANAGHNAPLRYSSKTGKYEYIEQKKNFVLGGIDGIKYDVQKLKIDVGDKIFLYTDGVTEATSIDKKLYGENRLKEYLNKNINLNLKETLEGVKQDIDLFVNGEEQSDDITMLIAVYKSQTKD